jgi:hypothetical protein
MFGNWIDNKILKNQWLLKIAIDGDYNKSPVLSRYPFIRFNPANKSDNGYINNKKTVKNYRLEVYFLYQKKFDYIIRMIDDNNSEVVRYFLFNHEGFLFELWEMYKDEKIRSEPGNPFFAFNVYGENIKSSCSIDEQFAIVMGCM